MVQQPREKKTRFRKTDPRLRKYIAEMYFSGEWTMKEIAEQFQITQPRVSQIVKEYDDS